MKIAKRSVKNYQIVSNNFLVDADEQDRIFQDFLIKFGDIHSVSLKHNIIRLPIEIQNAQVNGCYLCDHPLCFLGVKYQYTVWQPYLQHEAIEEFFNDLNILELLALWKIAVFTGTEEESFWYPNRTSIIVFRELRGHKHHKDVLVFNERRRCNNYKHIHRHLA